MKNLLFLTIPLVDLTVPLERKLPILAGQTIPISTIKEEPGGSANILIASQRIGLNVIPLGAVGADYYGSFLLDKYKKENITSNYIDVITGYETPKALVLIDPAAKHSFVCMLEGLFGDTSRMEDLVAKSDGIVLSGYLLAVDSTRDIAIEFLNMAHQNSKEIYFDPGPLIKSIPVNVLQATLRKSTVIIANEQEAELITGISVEEDAADMLYKQSKALVVVKSGGKGCFVKSGVQRGRWYKGFKVPVVDTTGAGDSFLSGLMFAHQNKWSEENTACFANALGAVKTSKKGSGTQVPTFGEIVKILQDNKINVPKENIENKNWDKEIYI